MILESTTQTAYHHSANTHNPYQKLEVNSVSNFHEIPRSVCNRTQAKKAIPRQPICLTDYDYDKILEEIGRRDKIEFERDVEVYSDDEEY